MAKRELAAMIIHGHSGKWDTNIANVRYVTHIGGNGEEAYVVFPLDGEPTVYVYNSGIIPWWLEAQNWVKDIRFRKPNVSEGPVERIRELHLEKEKIGVAGLGGDFAFWNLEGHIPYDTFANIKKELREARFESATDVLEEMRQIKSSEEISFIEKAAHIADLSIETMIETARAGVSEIEVYSRMVYEMLRNGAEPPIMLLWGCGRSVVHANRFPSSRTLQVGDLILNEITPRYGGYCAHPHQPVSVGKPSEERKRLFEVALESFDRGVEKLVPGSTLAEIDEAFHNPIRKAGYTHTRLSMHGLGLESPEGVTTSSPTWNDSSKFVIKENMVWGVEPQVVTSDQKAGITLGDTVITTNGKPRRPSKRKLELAVV